MPRLTTISTSTSGIPAASSTPFLSGTPNSWTPEMQATVSNVTTTVMVQTQHPIHTPYCPTSPSSVQTTLPVLLATITTVIAGEGLPALLSSTRSSSAPKKAACPSNPGCLMTLIWPASQNSRTISYMR